MNQLFGRSYSLKVLLPQDENGEQTVLTLSDNNFEPEALRITFNIQTIFRSTAWFAEINIYNLDQNTTKQIISGAQVKGAVNPPSVPTPVKQGMTCVLSAGYKNGNTGVIWNGPVFQALFSRENVVDFKITLHCMLWLDPMTRNSVSSVFSAFTTQQDVINKLVDLAFAPGTTVNVSPRIKSTQLSRGKVVFGSVAKYFTQMADDNNMQWFLDNKGINFAKLDDNLPLQETAKVFTPDNGIVGVPEQTQYGVNFRILLDPTVKVTYPAQLVKIDNSQIVLQKKVQNELPSILDQNGVYIVYAVNYIGDNRGQPWYAEIMGVTSTGGKLAMLQALINGTLNH